MTDGRWTGGSAPPDHEIVRVAAGDRASLCGAVLDDLPEWFGLADAKAAYVAASIDLPMLACNVEGEPVGFVSLKVHSAAAIELHVLGVKRRWHRRGLGRRLIEGAVRFAGDEGHGFVTVKTLASANPDPHYAVTRAFYDALGFVSIEVFPTLWGEANPCLLMLRPVPPPLGIERGARILTPPLRSSSVAARGCAAP